MGFNMAQINLIWTHIKVNCYIYIFIYEAMEAKQPN